MLNQKYANFLLVLIIVIIAMFILLCPRKQLSAQNNFYQPYHNQPYHNQQQQQSQLQPQPQYLLSEEEYPELVENGGQEHNKAVYIQELNMNYDTRGDKNDLININQLPSEGSMFIYP
jgi:hypothetical protein